MRREARKPSLYVCGNKRDSIRNIQYRVGGYYLEACVLLTNEGSSVVQQIKFKGQYCDSNVCSAEIELHFPVSGRFRASLLLPNPQICFAASSFPPHLWSTCVPEYMKGH